ncbi:MAG: putative metallopeptidase [Nanoarchaeota archaeon]
MRYDEALDLQERLNKIVRILKMQHIDLNRVRCFRSKGSSAMGVVARCHTIGKLMQKTIGVKAHYGIEFLERFDKMPRDAQDKVIIHELMHIPKTFGGGFRQHDFVCEDNVTRLHRMFKENIENIDNV